MSRLSSTDAVEAGAGTADADASAADVEAEALLARLRDALGDGLVESHTDQGAVWVRVERDAWADLARFLHDEEGFGFFNFLSAIDWMPSPFGRDMDSSVDNALDPPEPKEPPGTETGVARRGHPFPASGPGQRRDLGSLHHR